MTNEVEHAVQLDNAVISLQFVGGLVVAALGWYVRRQDARLDEIEKEVKEKVSLEVHNATLEALRREIREQGQQSTELIMQGLARTHDRVDKLLTIIAEKK